MTIKKRPVGANEELRVSERTCRLARILAQSGTVSRAFGRRAGFVLMMSSLFAYLSLNLTTIIILSKGTSFIVGLL
jgi:hypothetical protein